MQIANYDHQMTAQSQKSYSLILPWFEVLFILTPLHCIKKFFVNFKYKMTALNNKSWTLFQPWFEVIWSNFWYQHILHFDYQMAELSWRSRLIELNITLLHFLCLFKFYGEKGSLLWAWKCVGPQGKEFLVNVRVEQLHEDTAGDFPSPWAIVVKCSHQKHSFLFPYFLQKKKKKILSSFSK